MGTGMIGMQWIIFIGVAVVSWLRKHSFYDSRAAI